MNNLSPAAFALLRVWYEINQARWLMATILNPNGLYNVTIVPRP